VRVACRGGDDRGADALGPVMHAEAARGQVVAEGDATNSRFQSSRNSSMPWMPTAGRISATTHSQTMRDPSPAARRRAASDTVIPFLSTGKSKPKANGPVDSHHGAVIQTTDGLPHLVTSNSRDFVDHDLRNRPQPV
jgi:hypothetical protein